MKAGIYLGRKNVEVRELDMPEVGESDVLIQNIYSSICGTDVAVYTKGTRTGHKITVGMEFGHETISKVYAVGKNITEFKVGQRVYPYPRFAKNDTKRAGTIGGFSEYILIPEAKLNHSLYFVPDVISDKTACLIEPFTVGCRAARRSNPAKNENAVVFGCGTIGIAAAIALKYFGIQKVMLADVSSFRLNIARNMGFAICNTAEQDFCDTAVSCFGNADGLSGATCDIDIFIDAAGAENILDTFMQYGKIGSRFVSVAVNNAIRSLDLLHMTYAQKSIIGSGGYMPEDVADVLKIMESGTWNIESIITHEFSLNDISKAIETASQSDTAFNVVIKF